LFTARKITLDDHDYLRSHLERLVARVEARGGKHIHKCLDIDKAMVGLYDHDHAYIVSGYLVVYQLGTPWFSDQLVLAEQLVLRLDGASCFSVVPAFLEREGREAKACLIEAGTALSLSDRALASLYKQAGFQMGGYALTKDISDGFSIIGEESSTDTG
jgi:hypothetical protein